MHADVGEILAYPVQYRNTCTQADPTVLGEFLADSQRFDCLEKPHVARVQAALKLTKKQVSAE